MLQMYNAQCTLYDVHVYSTITEHKQNTQLTCGAYLHPQDAIFVVNTVSVLDQYRGLQGPNRGSRDCFWAVIHLH